MIVCRWIPVFLVGVALLVTGCATKNELGMVQRDTEDLKKRLFALEKDLSGVKVETKDGLEKNLLRFQRELEAARKGNADLQANVDTFRVDQQVLAGKVDDLALSAKKPAEEMSLLREDSNRRLDGLEQKLQQLGASLDELKKKLEDGTKPTAAAQTPDSLYQSGRDAFAAGNTAKAREIFGRFLEQYPGHELSANATYWLGETYFKEKNYDQAIVTFQQVIKGFPKHEKVPAALLKQGLSFKELGDTKSARYVYKKLVEEFPQTEEAKLAKEKLKGLK